MRKIDEIKKKEAQQSAENEKLRTNIIAQKEEYNFLMEQREQRDRQITKKTGEVNEQQVRLNQNQRKKDKKIDEIQRVKNDKEEAERIHVRNIVFFS